MKRLVLYFATTLSLLAISFTSINESSPGQVYFNDFDGTLIVAPGVSDTLGGVTTLEPVQGYDGLGVGGNVFAGNFLRNITGGHSSSGGGIGTPGSPTTLHLSGLPPHTSIDLNFLLAIIDSWDGSEPGGCTICHPDILTVTVDGNIIFSESFGFNGPSFVPSPGVLLTEYTPLGFNPTFDDSAYDMGLYPAFDEIPHTASDLTIEWTASGAGWQGGDDESWAIDNLEIILKRTVEIDIKPGSAPNSINCDTPQGVIPVAVLTTDDFEAMAVDHTSITFEGASEVHINKKTGEPLRHEEDVDLDGDLDLVFHFALADTGLTCWSTEGMLAGMTYDGIPIEGRDSVRMLTNETPITLLLPYRGEVPLPDALANASLLGNLLSETTGQVVHVVVPEGGWMEGQNAAISGFQSGEVDLAFMSWAAYYVAFETSGALPGLNISRFGSHFYRSQILTYSGSGVVELTDLVGEHFCWGDPNSVSGYIVPSWMLLAEGFDLDNDIVAVPSGFHDQVVWDVYNQVCKGGATYVDARDAGGLPPDVKEIVYPIAVSPMIPNDGFAYAGGLSEDTRNQLTAAILAVAGTPEGGDLLVTLIGTNDGLIETDFSLYQGLYDLIYAAGLTPEGFWNP